MNSIKKSAVVKSDFVDTGKTDIKSGARLFQALWRRSGDGLMITILNDPSLKVDIIVDLQIMFSANAVAADPHKQGRPPPPGVKHSATTCCF